VSRSLHWAALFDAIEWQRSVLAFHDQGYGSAQPCCAPGNRCDAYQHSARLLARYERSKAALFAVLPGRKRAGDDEEPEAAQPAAERSGPPASVFRCAKCGDGSRLRGWAHVNVHGDVGPDGLIERSDYEDDMAFNPIIEESVTCKIHGEGFIQKLAGGGYTSVTRLAMVNGRYVTGPRTRRGGEETS